MPDDTVYYLGIVGIDLISGDTLQVLPSINKIYKKFGSFYWGMWAIMEGVKIDGIRYGTVFPFPEEITFSADSLYSEFIGDTVNCFIRNTSDYDVVLDSILTSSMYGYLMRLIKDNDYFFVNLFIQYPNHPLDTLKYTIPAHDSIQLQIYDIDLCPICKQLPQDYFEDTLRFVFTFNDEYVYSFSNYIRISGEGDPSDVEEDKILPNEIILYQNYPNPFNPSTSIQYVLGSRRYVQLKVYDVLGNEVAILVNEERPEGSYEVNFKASKLSSGIYFYKLQAGSFFEIKKMILLR